MGDIPELALDTAALNKLKHIYLSQGVSSSLVEKLKKQSLEDVKTGSTNCVFVFSTMTETEFSELMGVLFPDDSFDHDLLRDV